MGTPRSLIAAALIAPALAGAGARAGDDVETKATRVEVEHRLVTTARGYDAVTAAFRRGLGTLDEPAFRRLLREGDAGAARAALERMAGPSGFMLFGTQEHGDLLGLVGIKARAVQYVVGNPLYAVEMTRRSVGAGLYAPLRVLIYEREGGGACIEYDLPSSLFGQARDPEVDRRAAGLDRRLEALVDAAARPTEGAP